MAGVRVVNVRPKPGFVLDAARGDVVPSNIVPFRASDNLFNAMSGMGSGRDIRKANTYVLTPPLTQYEIAAACRSGLMKKIVSIPALDMVREWRDWTGLDDDEASAVWDEEKRLGLRKKVQQVETLRELGGGALILGLPGIASEPPPDTITRGQLAFVHVASRWHLSFEALQDDATQPGYGEPAMWQMHTSAGQQRVHPSRVIPWRADTSTSLAAPATWTGADAFWGESTVQKVLDAVQDNDTVRAAFAALTSKARLVRFAIPGLMDMIANGLQADVQARLEAVRLAESIHNATIVDGGDEEGNGGEKITDAQYNFAGAKDMLHAFAEIVASVSDIPQTRLLGRAPEGMNASGDSQQKDWQKLVRARQTLDLGPSLERVDRYLLQSAGVNSDTAANEWASLDTPGQKETAERFKTQTEAIEKLQNTGTIPDQAFARGVQSLMIEEGYLPELEAALSELGDDERYGLEPDLAEGGDPDDLAGAGGSLEAEPSRRAANDSRFLADAAPKTLYVQRKVVNAAEIIRWAKSQGLTSTLPADDMHVTIAFSRKAVDWFAVGADWSGDEDGKIRVKPGGLRDIERLGETGDAVVLLFADDSLKWRHERIIEAGASWDWPEYRPHITLSYDAEGVVVDAIEPYTGPIVLGPELFAEVDEDWKEKVSEK